MALTERIMKAAKALTGVYDDNAETAAFGLLSGTTRGAGESPKAGTREILASYSTMPWLRAVTGRVASSVSSASWKLFTTRRSGVQRAYQAGSTQRADYAHRQRLLKTHKAQGELVEIENHPFFDLLHSANSFQTGSSMRKITQLHIDLAGEAFWIKERNALGTPVAVWPIPPHWIAETPTPGRRAYRVSWKGWQGEIPDTEVLWFVEPDPSNPYGRGSGIAKSLGDELDTDEYAAKHVRSFFVNHARPDVLVFPKNGDEWSEPETRRLEMQWNNQLQGFWRSFRTFFARREIGIEKFDQDFRSMQFIELRRHERDAIIQVFGMPPEILGVVNESKRSTIEAADFLFARHVVQPRLEFLRTVLQERLIPEFDERLIVDYDSPVMNDKEHKLEVGKAAPWVMTVNEWRESIHLTPLDDEGGSQHFVPNTMRPTSDLTDVPEPPVAPLPKSKPHEVVKVIERDVNGRISAVHEKVIDDDA